MMHVGLIFFFAGPLGWVASPDRAGIIASGVISALGALLLLLGVLTS